MFCPECGEEVNEKTGHTDQPTYADWLSRVAGVITDHFEIEFICPVKPGKVINVIYKEIE